MVSKEKRRQYASGAVYQRAVDGRWFGVIEAGYTGNGTRRRVTVSARSEAEAKRRLRDRKAQIEREGAYDADATRATVKAVADQWLGVVGRKVRPSTYADYRSTVQKWIVPTIGHRRVSDLTPRHLRELEDAHREEGTTSTTIRHTRAVLSVLLRFAEQEGITVRPSVLSMNRPEKATHDRTAIPTPDALALLDHASRLPHGSRWVMALLQGMRQGECLGLTWESVDLVAGRVVIDWQLRSITYLDRKAETFLIPDGYECRRLRGNFHLVRPKSESGHRTIPLVSAMRAILTKWRMESPDNPWGLVWPSADGKPRSSRDDRDEWYGLQAAAGIAHPSGRPYLVHEARNTTATLLRDLDVDESIRVQILGHSSITVTRGYQAASTDLARLALEKVAERLQITTN